METALSGAPRRRALPFGSGRELGVFGVLIVLYALLAFKEPSFRGWVNFRNVLTQISMVAIVAVGMTAVIISGGIDLSVGSVAALAACVGGVLMTKRHWNGPEGVLITLAVGAA